MKILKRSGLLIPTKYRNTQWYVDIKEHLGRRTRSYGNSAMVVNLFYLESEKFLLIPRNFPLQKYLSDYEIQDHSHPGAPINIEHDITPRGKVQEKTMKYMMDHENGTIQLAPGVGKTVITIYMIAERKVKSLILVHRDSLADQWRDRFETFTSLNLDDIARLKSATFHEDLQKPIIIATTQTFISLLKRRREEFLIALDAANIGVFVADEVHTSVGAPTFSECSIHMPSKYTYGLSATPYRYDGNGDIIRYHLGDIFSDDDAEGTMPAKVTVVLLDYEIDTAYRTKYIWYEGEFQRARYLNLIKNSKPFMAVIRGLLARFKVDRDFICMIERIKLIDELYDWLKSNSKSKFCGTAKLDALDYKHTFTTPGKCRDGIDAPQKDAVIMTSPISNVEQLSGRVTREVENKNMPVIVDMVDIGCHEMSKTFRNRNVYYKKKEWEVQYVLFKNGRLASIEEDIALKIIRGE